MGHIKEPVDFFVENMPFTEADRKQISEIIAHYKKTGKKKIVATRRSARPKKARHYSR